MSGELVTGFVIGCVVMAFALGLLSLAYDMGIREGYRRFNNDSIQKVNNNET